MTNLSGTNLDSRVADGPEGEGRESPSTFPKYPEYKDSGVEWLGEVPAKWGIAPLKAAFRIVGGSTPNSDPKNWDGDVVWVTPADLSGLNSFKITDSGRKITMSGLGSCGASLVPPESIVLSTRAPIGSLAIAKEKLCTNQGCKSLVPSTKTNSYFYAYLLGNSKETLNVRGKGTTFLELSGSELASFAVPVPSQKEQAAIAAFLDHETTCIDALVEEQQRLIELLKEKRQAVISHAVTRGLDPNVPMKDSGVEWLGEVPAHWRVVPLGLLARKIQTGPFGSQLHSHEYIEEGVPVINPSNIKDGRVVADTSLTVTAETAERLAHQQLQASELIIGRRGEMGRCATVSEGESGWLCGTGSMKVALKEYICPEFIALYIRTPTIRELLQLESVGSTMDNLNPAILSRVRVPVPPYHEQIAIVNDIQEHCTSLNALLTEAVGGVSLLKERRSALISAAVTGKIDVRSWQPPAQTAPARKEAVSVEVV